MSHLCFPRKMQISVLFASYILHFKKSLYMQMLGGHMTSMYSQEKQLVSPCSLIFK